MEPANEPEPERPELDHPSGDYEAIRTCNEEGLASATDYIFCDSEEPVPRIQQQEEADLPDKDVIQRLRKENVEGEGELSTTHMSNIEHVDMHEEDVVNSTISDSVCINEAYVDSPTLDSVAHPISWPWIRLQCCRCSKRSALFGSHNSDLRVTDGSIPAVAIPDSEPWAILDREGIVVAEDDGLPLTTTAVEAKMEQLLTWMLTPALHGNPKLGVLGAVDRASELLKSVPGRNVEAAVCEVVAGSERTVSLIVMNFCIERIPVLGCPAVLLRTMWGNLRSILIIAALYGHDLESARVQHEALLCLLPPGEDSGLRSRARSTANSSDASPLVAETAEKVAKLMIKNALRRATGLQAAGDCFELASILYRTCNHESVDEDGYVCVLNTPASAARDFFKQKSLASSALLWGSLPLLLMGIAAPALLALVRLAPIAMQILNSFAGAPSNLPSSMPALVMASPGLLLAVRAFRSGRRHVPPRQCSTLRLWNRIFRGREARWLRSVWPQVVTMSVFTLHAALPAISAFSSVSIVLDSAWLARISWSKGWDLLHAVACLVLGIYSFCTCVNTQLKHEFPHLNSESESRFARLCLRFLNICWAVARACCVLAAWTYALLFIDICTTKLLDGIGLSADSSVGHPLSAFGFISQVAWLLGALPDTSPFWSQKAISFCLSFISVGCQHRLLEVLSRREVLLRLIGAEKVMASSICLLLKGVAVACSNSKSANPIAEFLQTVAPPPSFCIFVVSLRKQAVVIGVMLTLVPRLMQSGVLGNMVSFICGLVGGAYAARTVLTVWYLNLEDLDSPALRLVLLVPGSVSGKAKTLLSGALYGARKRAVKLMAVGIIQRFLRWCFPPSTALTM